MLPPFPRLRGWKAGGWHTFFLSLVHALALMRQNARFLATKPRSGTKPGFLRSERRSASSKIPGRKNRRGTEGARRSSTRARTRFRGQKRPVLLHDRERGAQMVERRASEARNDPNGRHGLQAMCRTHAAPQTPGHTQRPPPGPPPTSRHRPLHCRRTGGLRKQPCHVRRRHCRVRKQRSARRDKPRTRRDSALPAPCPSRHCRPARVSSAAKPLSRGGVGGGAHRAKPSALAATPPQPRLRRRRHSVTIDNPLQPHSLKARGRPMQTPR